MDRFETVHLLGKGTFGEVFLVREKSTNQLLAMKRIRMRGLPRADAEAARAEAELLARLKHACIVTMNESFLDDEGATLCIVMEYCAGGDLAELIKRRRARKEPLSEDEVLDIFVQIALAVRFLHDHRVLHRDLKAGNCFIMSPHRDIETTRQQQQKEKQGGSGASSKKSKATAATAVANEARAAANGLAGDHSRNTRMVKLGDLGVAKVLHTEDFAKTVIGTPYSLAPEICEGKKYAKKSDIWSLGCVLYELCTLRHAFDGRTLPALVLRIINGRYPPIVGYSPGLCGMVASMLRQDPRTRPNIRQLLRLPIMRNRVRAFAAQTPGAAPGAGLFFDTPAVPVSPHPAAGTPVSKNFAAGSGIDAVVATAASKERSKLRSGAAASTPRSPPGSGAARQRQQRRKASGRSASSSVVPPRHPVHHRKPSAARQPKLAERGSSKKKEAHAQSDSQASAQQWHNRAGEQFAELMADMNDLVIDNAVAAASPRKQQKKTNSVGESVGDEFASESAGQGHCSAGLDSSGNMGDSLPPTVVLASPRDGNVVAVPALSADGAAPMVPRSAFVRKSPVNGSPEDRHHGRKLRAKRGKRSGRGGGKDVDVRPPWKNVVKGHAADIQPRFVSNKNGDSAMPTQGGSASAARSSSPLVDEGKEQRARIRQFRRDRAEKRAERKAAEAAHVREYKLGLKKVRAKFSRKEFVPTPEFLRANSGIDAAADEEARRQRGGEALFIEFDEHSCESKWKKRARPSSKMGRGAEQELVGVPESGLIEEQQSIAHRTRSQRGKGGKLLEDARDVVSKKPGAVIGKKKKKKTKRKQRQQVPGAAVSHVENDSRGASDRRKRNSLESLQSVRKQMRKDRRKAARKRGTAGGMEAPFFEIVVAGDPPSHSPSAPAASHGLRVEVKDDDGNNDDDDDYGGHEIDVDGHVAMSFVSVADDGGGEVRGAIAFPMGVGAGGASSQVMQQQVGGVDSIDDLFVSEDDDNFEEEGSFTIPPSGPLPLGTVQQYATAASAVPLSPVTTSTGSNFPVQHASEISAVSTPTAAPAPVRSDGGGMLISPGGGGGINGTSSATARGKQPASSSSGTLVNRADRLSYQVDMTRQLCSAALGSDVFERVYELVSRLVAQREREFVEAASADTDVGDGAEEETDGISEKDILDVLRPEKRRYLRDVFRLIYCEQALDESVVYSDL